MNPLKKRIGIIGGGQLGKMMALEAKKMGIFVAVLDPAEVCPCSHICDVHIRADFSDSAAFRQLAEMTDVMTYEFEHIDAKTLIGLEAEGFLVYPTAKSLVKIQNKFVQKTELRSGGVPVGDFMAITSENDLSAAFRDYGFPFFIKSVTGGYDGKGNRLISSEKEASEAFREFSKAGIGLMAERFVSFSKEISVLACRSIEGEIEVYPVAENIHVNSILFESFVPAIISESDSEAAQDAARKVMKIFEGVGMFCVELFVLENGGILVNEVAPRPHNSGHYTIEACVTSQFEQHIRAVAGLPLGSSRLLSPVVMRNIIGPDDISGSVSYTYDGVEDMLGLKGLSFHNYGKTFASKRRKLGHFTVLAENVEKAHKAADSAQKLLQVKEDM